MKKKIIIIGAGPAGLFSAWLLLEKGHSVSLYEKTKGVGKKFLIAGKSGLNLTHSSSLENFSSQYGKDQEYFKKLLKDFSSAELIEWAEGFGVETFIGTSGRVFPKEMKAAKFLKVWFDKLKAFDTFSFYPEHEFESISKEKEVTFANGVKVIAETVIFALGGGSWKITGSDGSWVDRFKGLELKVQPLRPSNCGFNIKWSEHLLSKAERLPLKNIKTNFDQVSSRGELMITDYGIEGTGIYEISDELVRSLDSGNKTIIHIDLFPDLTDNVLLTQIKSKRAKDSFSNFLRKTLRMSKEKSYLVNEYLDRDKKTDPEYLYSFFRSLPIVIEGVRPIDEAISTSGGVDFNNLTKGLEMKGLAGVYFAGEMLDFSAPTGGYLLQACFSSASRIANAIK